MSFDVDHLRATEFPAVTSGGTVYLNNASTGPMPRRSLDALHAFNAMRAEPHRITLEDQFGTAARARELIARLINAEPGEIALMVNTTYGINLAARALRLGPGDVVVGCDKEFPANIYPWMALARDGVRFDMVPCQGVLPDEDAIVAALDRPGVRALAISWVSFATGYRVDLARLGRECRARGIYLVVDAMQGVGALMLDVRETPVDILACGGQKWLLSPWGTGFVYVRDELVQRLEPYAVGWMA
ncbi:MAG: aminotransferase class V-fold PLP-dependent enzyme, partial [Gemmatimonadota bacterium]|nr:aminotransferase class V-fold PLP-dependent enzyme [Gemmatimonadota bacterium]